MNGGSAVCGLLLLLACCTSTIFHRVGEAGPVLRWSAIKPPAGAEDLRYELVVFKAEQWLPRKRHLSASRLTTTEYEPRGLPPGEYVWSVRARYRRDGREWVTRWRCPNALAANALVPERGFGRLSVK